MKHKQWQSKAIFRHACKISCTAFEHDAGAHRAHLCSKREKETSLSVCTKLNFYLTYTTQAECINLTNKKVDFFSDTWLSDTFFAATKDGGIKIMASELLSSWCPALCPPSFNKHWLLVCDVTYQTRFLAFVCMFCAQKDAKGSFCIINNAPVWKKYTSPLSSLSEVALFPRGAI